MTGLLDEAGDFRPHLKAKSGVSRGFSREEVQKIPLRHQREEAAPRRQVREVGDAYRDVSDLCRQLTHFLVRQLQEGVQHSQFVHHFERRGVDRVAAKVSQEVRVFLEDDDADAGAGQQQSEHHAGRPTAGDAALRRGWIARHRHARISRRIGTAGASGSTTPVTGATIQPPALVDEGHLGVLRLLRCHGGRLQSAALPVAEITTPSAGAQASVTGFLRSSATPAAWGTSTHRGRPWAVTSSRTTGPRNVTTSSTPQSRLRPSSGAPSATTASFSGRTARRIPSPYPSRSRAIRSRSPSQSTTPSRAETTRQARRFEMPMKSATKSVRGRA